MLKITCYTVYSWVIDLLYEYKVYSILFCIYLSQTRCKGILIHQGILWKNAREACFRRAFRVPHRSSSNISETGLRFANAFKSNEQQSSVSSQFNLIKFLVYGFQTGTAYSILGRISVLYAGSLVSPGTREKFWRRKPKVFVALEEISEHFAGDTSDIHSPGPTIAKTSL